MKMFRKDEGFTLVELMVVVLIIGILVAIAIPVFSAAKANAQKNSCYANERTVEGAYQTWIADNPTATKPSTWALLTTSGGASSVVPNYVKATPSCPASGTYSATFTNGSNSVTISCDASGHGQHP
jgi:prepilin-type N-terminal cleavage/methylation domain-containing protein